MDVFINSTKRLVKWNFTITIVKIIHKEILEFHQFCAIGKNFKKIKK